MNVRISFSQQLASAQQTAGVSDAQLSGQASQLAQNFNVNLNNLTLGSAAGAAAGTAAATPGTISVGADALTNIMSQWGGKMDQTAQMGAALDQMETQAEELMKSPKKEDQMKGQEMMQAMSQIMEAMIKAIQQTGQSAKDAIQAAGH